MEDSKVDMMNKNKIIQEADKYFSPPKNVKDKALRQEEDSSSSDSEDEATTVIPVTKQVITEKNTEKQKLDTTTEHDNVKRDDDKESKTDSGETTNKIKAEEITTTTIKPKVYTEKDIKDIYQTAHLVSEDDKVQDFIKEIQQNSKSFFLTMKNKIDDVRSKNKIDFISRSYDEKFNEFLNETQSQKILTRLGTQKVILNIIDTSNGIIKRLVNYLIGDMQKKGAMRTGAIGILEGEVINEEKQDYIHACEKFGVCRAKDRFSLYAADFLTEILSGDDNKVKLATDCFTELIKDADYSRFCDKKLKKQIVDNMEWIDQIKGKELRPLLTTFKNMLVSKNKPLVVMPDAYGSAMNKSVAFLDLVDAFDEKLSPTSHRIKEWNESINAVREWVAGLRNDAMDIMTKFSAQFLIKASRRMKGKMVRKVSQNLKILFKSEPGEEM